MQPERSLADRLVPVYALLLGATVVLLARGPSEPVRVPHIVYVPTQPTCKDTIQALWDSDGQRIECSYKGQRLDVVMHGDRWFGKCSCVLETFSASAGPGSAGAGGDIGAGRGVSLGP